MEWEYDVEHLTGDDPVSIRAEIERVASEGWELVSVTYPGSLVPARGLLGFFRRERRERRDHFSDLSAMA